MPAILAALLVLVLWAAPAQGKLVYVKGPGTASPVVYVASDTGKQPRRLGVGRAPAISPNGKWVAFVTQAEGGRRLETVVLQQLRHGARRLVMRSRSVASLRFSPDSTKLAAVLAEKRVSVYDVASDRVSVAGSGPIRGYSFSPDSKQVVFGKAARQPFDAPADLYVGPVLGGATPKRITRTRDALNPVWGPKEIFFDRQQRRAGDAPAYNLWAIDAAAKMRQLTKLKIPRLVSGLVPLEVSADAARLLSVFTGQDSEVGFTVATATGKTRALSRDFEHGIVGFDLSADGRFILGHTGGPDPSSAHDVVRVRYGGGGKPKVLVADAAYPDWTR